jgi:hypothetical protein
VGNEENAHPLSDLNKTMINIAKESKNACKNKPSKKKSLQNSWRRY